MLSMSDALLSLPVLVLWVGPAAFGAVWAGVAAGRRLAALAQSARKTDGNLRAWPTQR